MMTMTQKKNASENQKCLSKTTKCPGSTGGAADPPRRFFAVWFFQVYHVQMRNVRYVEQFHVYLSIYLSIYLYFFLSFFLSVCLSVCLSFFLFFLSLFLSFLFFLYFFLSIFMCIYIYIYIFKTLYNMCVRTRVYCTCVEVGTLRLTRFITAQTYAEAT